MFCYTLFRDKLKPINLRLVILSINNSDISDVVFRGGFSRFQNDGTTLSRIGPPFELLFKNLFLFRLYTFVFRDIESHFSKQEASKLRQEAVNEIVTSIANLDSLCRSRNAKLIVAIHPFPGAFTSAFGIEIPNEDDILKTAIGLKNLKKKVDYVNLYNPFKEAFKKEDYLNYSWKINGHFNERGYELFSKLLYDKMMKDSLYIF